MEERAGAQHGPASDYLGWTAIMQELMRRIDAAGRDNA